MPEWTRYAIFWGVFPLGFTGAEDTCDDLDAPVRHRLPRLLGWLDHLVELGCNGLLLNPLFASMSHGYDTLDYFRIDPRLGDLDDFDALVAACHERGIRVVLDGVFNHVGRGYPQLAEALERGDDASAASLFKLHTDGDRIQAEVFEGEQQLVVLDHDDETVQQLVREVMTYWLERGIDGWRLDAAYALPPQFWTSVIPAVRERFADSWFLGEMIHGDYAGYAETAGLDSITQYELWKAIWSSIETANLFELDHALGRHATLLQRIVPFTFLDNHDTSRVASQITDARHWGHAAALLLFLPGIPCLYYGDELGMTGVKEQRLGGDQAIRPPMPVSPDQVASVDEQLRDAYRRLIALRRRTPWLTDAEITTSEVGNTYLRVTARPRSGNQTPPMTLVLNLSDEPGGLPEGSTLLEASHPDQPYHVAAHGWAIVQAG
ncbi:MAG: alpha-amylase family protein [Microlunatus sp.]|nr:alpha-amylase family protein [Microlunatus sp.]